MKQITILLTAAFLTVITELVSTTKTTAAYKEPLPRAQQEAFTVLQTQCNICHRDQNPSKVFTTENMNGFAKKIKRQVFVWKRMPKGKDNNLTEEEKEILKAWLNQQLKK